MAQLIATGRRGALNGSPAPGRLAATDARCNAHYGSPAPVTAKPKRRQPERAMQVALFRWVELQKRVYPDLALLFAIPNGGERNAIVAAKMKAEGVRRGVPDLFLPVPRGLWHGLFIELKAGRNTASPEQKEWIARLSAQGYRVEVMRDDWLKVTELIVNYLTGRAS